MTKHFKISWDLTLKIATAFVIVLFLGLAGFAGLFDKEAESFEKFAIPVILLAIVLVCYLYAPTSYDVSDSEITVNRPAGSRKISRSAIKSITVPTKKEMKGTWRTLGVGGLFGYYGSFTNSHFGDMVWFVTNRKNMVVVHAGYDKFVFSPDDINDFTKALEVTE